MNVDRRNCFYIATLIAIMTRLRNRSVQSG